MAKVILTRKGLAEQRNTLIEQCKALQGLVGKWADDEQTTPALEARNIIRQLYGQIATMPMFPSDDESIDNVRVQRATPLQDIHPQKAVDILNFNIAMLMKMRHESGDFPVKFEITQLLRTFYAIQRVRIMASNRAKALERGGLPNDYLKELVASQEAQEAVVCSVMQAYNKNHAMHDWLASVKGIGPILMAGLTTTFDITKAPTAGHFWSYCGMVPGKRRQRGVKLTFNPLAKTTAYKCAVSFVFTSGGKAPSFYGTLYKLRKKHEEEQNTSAVHGEMAADILRTRNFTDDTKAKSCYEQGIFPPAHLEARAKRWTAKLFLAHLHEKWYEKEYNKPAPLPYAQVWLDHVHIINPPYISYDDKGIIKPFDVIKDGRGKTQKQ